MKYDPIELMKLNITEADIQKQRDLLLKGITESNAPFVVTIIDKFWLPFIIDLLDGNQFNCVPFQDNYIKIEIKL